MSEIIKTINESDAVTIKVTINCEEAWEYDYLDRGTHYSGNYNDGMPHTHAIGMPHELHLKTDVWTIRVVNSKDTKVNGRMKIEWLQQDTVIHTWPTVAADQVINVPAGENKYGGDGTFL